MYKANALLGYVGRNTVFKVREVVTLLYLRLGRYLDSFSHFRVHIGTMGCLSAPENSDHGERGLETKPVEGKEPSQHI